MSLQDKYKTLIDTAQQSGVTNLQVKEQDDVLYIDGEAPSAAIKDKLWSVYNEIDPDYKTGDVIPHISKIRGLKVPDTEEQTKWLKAQ